MPCPPPRDLPKPGIKTRSPTLQADSLLSEPPGKPKNTGVGSLSLLQGNFPTQELNWGLLHCRQIPYQLSYQGSLKSTTVQQQQQQQNFNTHHYCSQAPPLQCKPPQPLLMSPWNLGNFWSETRSQGPPELGQAPEGLWWLTVGSCVHLGTLPSKGRDQG